METRTFLLPFFLILFSLRFFFSSFFKGKAVLSWCLGQFGFSNRLDALDVYLSSLEKVINDCGREFRFKKKNLEKGNIIQHDQRYYSAFLLRWSAD